MNTIEQKEIARKLAEPFHPAQLHWRVGSTNAKQLGCKPWEATKGMPLAYIDARNVQDRLNEVIGVFNWESHITKREGVTFCSLTILGVTKTDAGADTQTEAEKGGASDAFKRAAVHFGVGRYLYDFPNTWLDLDIGKNQGKLVMKSYKCKGIHYKAPIELPDWAIPMPDEVKAKVQPLYEAMDAGDEKTFKEIWLSYSQQQQEFVWGYFKNAEQKTIRAWV